MSDHEIRQTPFAPDEAPTAADMSLAPNEAAAPVSMMDGFLHPTESFYTSLQMDGSRADRIKIYNALDNKGTSLSDCIGKDIQVSDIAIHPIKVLNEKTGTLDDCLRAILISPDGSTYDAVSEGVVSSLQRMIMIVGQPSWADDPITVCPYEQKTRAGYKVMKLKMK